MSSSGHIALVPELLRWDYGLLDPELRKSFEVALHAGTAAALLIALRDEVSDVVGSLDARRVAGVALAFVPPAAFAFAFERPIERLLGSPRAVAAAQVVAGVALGAADARPAVRGQGAAGALDHLAIGLGQAAALAPGVSRNGATLTVLRLRRFDRRAANRLSRIAIAADVEDHARDVVQPIVGQVTTLSRRSRDTATCRAESTARGRAPASRAGFAARGSPCPPPPRASSSE